MNTQKLHDLIDKVIGKEGPLRTPAYWMRRVLNRIADDTENLNERLTRLQKDVQSIPANYIIKEYEAGETDKEYITIWPNEYSKIKKSEGHVVIEFFPFIDKNVVNEFVTEFRPTGSLTVSFPSKMQWMNDIPPAFESNKTYVVSIIDNMAVFVEF